MKTNLAGIPALLPGARCELYTFYLKSGVVLCYSTADKDLVYRGSTYLSGVFNIERGTIKSTVGIKVDDVTLTVHPTDGFTIDGISLSAFIDNGGLDWAILKIERARSDRVVHLFEGFISDAQGDRLKADLTVSAPTILLDVQMPRNVYTPGCIHSLYKGGCGLNRADFAVAGTVESGSSVLFLQSGLSQDAGYFDLGSIDFTSGANSGVTRTIRHYQSGQIVLAYPLPHSPAVGDGFIAYPGCDKRRVTCDGKFANAARYRGFPLIPVPEQSV
ncbi:phage BR0599 family protein [Methylovulum psychrotolerans]|uniref:DUF2163 domain-containing protein n=1 Tax=Methylovulum psychrotolerans TaxID=1704499 RepID=UPI001BFF7EF9|nr:DUF2163 domain-containing protein [Methylovulum psychrotolerans]MBT9098392.1 phage BR0599 family protein [Methylovulum psychrotolerans]